ncbi:MAG: hypothetical protein ACRDK4_02725 [Solirubrobacteraceae bacterium]
MGLKHRIGGRRARRLRTSLAVAVFALSLAGSGSSAFATVAPKFQLARGAFPTAMTTADGTITLSSSTAVVECTSGTGTGKLLSATEAKLTLKFTGCFLVESHIACASGIETKELKAALAYTYPSKATSEGRETGLVLSPASGEVVSEFSCSIVKVVLKGSLIAVVKPLKTRAKTLALTIKQSGFSQQPAEYEGEGGSKVTTGLTCSYSGRAAEKCGMEQSGSTAALSGEEATVETEGSTPLPEFSNHEGVTLTGVGGNTIFEKTNQAKWNYTSANVAAEISGAKSLQAVISFKQGGVEACNNGTETGEMVWKNLKGRLGYINGTSKEVGVIFEPASQPLANCTATSSIYKGTVVAKITPVNTKTSNFVLHFEQSLGVQNPLSLEWGEAIPLEIVTSAAVEAGLQSEVPIKASKEMEIRG